MNKRIWFLALSSSLLTLHSCKQDTGSLGANVLPASDKIGAYEWDTTTIRSSIFLKDSMPTTPPVVTSLLGSYDDPVFGNTKASLYVSFLAALGSASYTQTPFLGYGLDSVVVILPFNTSVPYYGSPDPQTIQIYNLETPVINGHTYYQDTNLAYYKTPIFNGEVIPNPSDSGSLLRIRLSIANNSWARNVYNSMANSINGLSNFQNLPLNEYGFYITPANPLQLPGQGAIWYINLEGSASGGLYFYYSHQTVGDTENSIQFDIGNAGIGPFFSHFEHGYANTPFYNGHPSGDLDSMNSPAFMYVQAMCGVEGKITFPYLKNWAKLKPVLINQAELVLPVVQQYVGLYTPPENLYLLGDSANGHIYDIPDEYYSYYGGSFDNTNYQYVFIITQYIQQVIDGTRIDNGLYVLPSGIASSANRVVLYGGQNGVNSMKLKIFYTPLKK